MTPDSEILPKFNALSFVMAHTWRLIELHIPGFMDELVESVENEALFAEVIRMRAPRDERYLREEREEGAVLARHARTATYAAIGADQRRKARKR